MSNNKKLDKSQVVPTKTSVNNADKQKDVVDAPVETQNEVPAEDQQPQETLKEDATLPTTPETSVNNADKQEDVADDAPVESQNEVPVEDQQQKNNKNNKKDKKNRQQQQQNIAVNPEPVK